MRVSADVKQQTRRRLLDVAHKMLARNGLQGVTTRDVAAEAGLAHGTLFNYFPTKEALALALCRQLLAEAEAEFEQRQRGDESLEEALFAHVAAGLRELQPFRPWAGGLLGATFRPAAGHSPAAEPDGHGAPADDDPCALQSRHLAIVRGIIARHLGDEAAGPVALHLYWSLYLGVLAWWSADGSPHQEDTLAVLDRSLHMFTTSLGAPTGDPSASGTQDRPAAPARSKGQPGHRASRRKESRHEP